MLTHVVYPDGEQLGQPAAFITLLPVLAFPCLCVAFVARRELQLLSVLMGYLGNAACCDLLKRCLQQPRPAGAVLDGFGMPSNHTQTMSFVVAYGICFLWHEATMRDALIFKPLLSLLGVLLVVAVGVSRVYLGEHTEEQVLVGGLCGLALGVAWQLMYARVARPALLPLLDGGCCRYFYIRDSSHIPDVLRKEHEWQHNLRLRAVQTQTDKVS
uniref:Phosphatidic acid phosphatase type 2/haloperoxidase domain-containing protein n=1 Tax=Coccolithus braarudii TaxID=221442 RepID=A0A7S0LDD4_9EUKA|mmetsp:Transcript_32247/g.69324  ORF Transcript_32247/g.69324 Transcript_32247/m.69324 type:complete len:214 (+) Transcript_32247:208-849(+)